MMIFNFLSQAYLAYVLFLYQLVSSRDPCSEAEGNLTVLFAGVPPRASKFVIIAGHQSRILNANTERSNYEKQEFRDIKFRDRIEIFNDDDDSVLVTSGCSLIKNNQLSKWLYPGNNYTVQFRLMNNNSLSLGFYEVPRFYKHVIVRAGNNTQEFTPDFVNKRSNRLNNIKYVRFRFVDKDDWIRIESVDHNNKTRPHFTAKASYLIESGKLFITQRLESGYHIKFYYGAPQI